MSRSWNHKAVIDILVSELWNATTANVILWLNEIQDDLATEIPVDFFKFKLKKLLPTEQELISLSPDIPDAPTVAISSGGSLTNGSTYKVYVTFKIFNPDGTVQYIESEPSVASSAVAADASNATIDVSAIPTYPGDTSVEPASIYREIYVATLASGGSAYGEPFYHGEIADNTTTTYSITSEPASTRTPPSASEVDQLSSEHPVFLSSNKYLVREDANKLRRIDSDSYTTAAPTHFDFIGLDKIFLYGKLSSGATTAQRTLSYYVLRRPHEFFYDVDLPVDLPIQAKKALISGVIYKGWRFNDRDGWVSQKNIYEQEKQNLIDRLTRQRGAPGSIRDVNGDTWGYEV